MKLRKIIASILLTFLCGLFVFASNAKVYDTSLCVHPAVPGGMFFENEALSFKLDFPGNTNYVVKNIFGKKIITGKSKQGKIILPQLPRGYYLLEVTSAKFKTENSATFSVIPPRAKLPAGVVPMYAVDGAVSGNPEPDDKRRPWRANWRDTLDILHRSGVFAQRERTCPTWNYQRKCFIADEVRAFGIESLGLCAGIAEGAWANKYRTGKIPNKQFKKKSKVSTVDDLTVAYKFLRRFAKDMHGKLRYCEIMNEPQYYADSAWEIVAEQKMAYLALKAGAPGMDVLSFSFCQNDDDFFHVVNDSKTAAYFDIFNIHCYRSLREFPSFIAAYRENMNAGGYGDRALFITENGATYENGIKGKISTLKPGTREHTLDQELIQAEFLVKSMLKMQTLGVDMNCFFYIPNYHEQNGDKDWSSIRTNHSAKPNLTALANLSHYLAPTKYLGKIALPDGYEGMLFQYPDKSQVLVIWRLSYMDMESGSMKKFIHEKPQTITLNLDHDAKSYQVADMFGTRSRITAENGKLALPVTNLPLYVIGLHNLRPVVWNKNIAGKIGATTLADTDKSIVARAITRKGLSISNNGNFAILSQPSGVIEIELYNFDNKEKTGMLSCSGVNISGLPETIKIPPMEKFSVKCKLSPLSADIFQKDFKIDGIFNGKKITPAVIPMVFECNKNAIREMPLLGSQLLENWHSNASEPMKKEKTSDGILFSCKFSHGNRWMYPEYRLQNDESLRGSVGIAFDIKLCKAITGGIGHIYFVTGKDAKMVDYGSPKGVEDWIEVRFYYNYSEERLKNIRKIKIGKNPGANNAWFEIRNLRTLYLKKSPRI